VPATITAPDGAQLRPVLILAHETSRDLGTRAHTVLGSAVPEFTYSQPGTRTGELRLFWDSYAPVAAAQRALVKPGLFAMRNPEEPEWNMTFAAVGSMNVERLGQDGIRVFGLSVGFVEAFEAVNAFALYPSPDLYPSDDLYPAA
jgi:hypothetical protein